MSPRHRGRMLALQYLYSWVFNPLSLKEIPSYMLYSNDGKENLSYYFALMLFNGVIENIQLLDQEISPLLNNWTIDRIDKVDLCILRIAAYELLFQKDTPSAVVINEAVLLAKSFSQDQSYKFINGVLEKIGKKVV